MQCALCLCTFFGIGLIRVRLYLPTYLPTAGKPKGHNPNENYHLRIETETDLNWTKREDTGGCRDENESASFGNDFSHCEYSIIETDALMLPCLVNSLGRTTQVCFSIISSSSFVETKCHTR